MAKVAYLMGDRATAKWGYLVTNHASSAIVRSYSDPDIKECFKKLINEQPEYRRVKLAELHRMGIHMAPDNNSPRHIGHAEHDLKPNVHLDDAMRSHVKAYCRSLLGKSPRDTAYNMLRGETVVSDKLPVGMDPKLEEFYTDLGFEVIASETRWDAMDTNAEEVPSLYPQPHRYI
jgi:hypothetical protein